MKIKNLFALGLLFSIVLMFSCEEKKNDLTEPENEIESSDTIQDNSLSKIVDYKSNPIQCNITIDSLDPHVINNFGLNIEFPMIGNRSVYSIFRGESRKGFGYFYPLEPVVEYTKDERSIKKIIASWDLDSVRALTDSIYQDITKIGPRFHKNLNHYDSYIEGLTVIYVNLLNINRYGSATIRISDSEMNDYLVYDMDENSEKAINISAQDFQDKYGDAFCSSLTLGTLDLMEGYIFGLSVQPDSRNAALREAIIAIQKYLSGEKEWEELVADSKYLINSTYMDCTYKIGMGYSSSLTTNYTETINQMDSLYKLGEFILYSKGFQLYSDIYPYFDFNEVEIPY